MKIEQQNNYLTAPTAPHIKTSFWFWLFSAIHLLTWTLIPTFLRGNLPFDSAEGIAWGNLWQWGYDKHPFLAPWLTAGITDLFGVVGWPVYLLSQIVIVICFWAIWRLANRILPPVHALISALLLEGIYYYTIASPQFNPNILMLGTWALAWFTFYIASKEQKWWQWIIAGFFAGLTLDTKYEGILLLVSFFIFTLVDPHARTNYRKAGIYIGVLTAFATFAPNLIWLFQHNFLPLLYTEDRLDTDHFSRWAFLNHIVHPLHFLLEQIGAVFPIVVLASPVLLGPRTQATIGTFNRNFLIIAGLGPMVLTLLDSAITGIWLHSLWAFPYFSLTGIMLMAWYKPIINKTRLKRFAILFIILTSAAATARGLFLYGEAYSLKQNISALFPGQELSEQVSEIWYSHYQKPLKYVAGTRTRVFNVIAYSKDHIIPYFDWDPLQNPWLANENDLRQYGAMFVWQQDHTQTSQSIVPPGIKQRFPTMIVLPPIVLKHLTHAKMHPYVFGVAILPPAETK